MQRLINIQILLILSANILTAQTAGAAKLELPPCPVATEREFMPDANKPLWTGCKDDKGLYQGLIVQFSNQLEILRVAGVKDSMRDGREIRFGESNTLEERNFKGGHLNGKSFIFKAEVPLGRIFPKPATAADWSVFSTNSQTSALKPWLANIEPLSTIDFIDGRMSELKYAENDFHFKVTKEGRMFALDHKEMKNLFFIDPQALRYLNAADLKLALLPGFGSCKKYSGPISRFGRHYDHLLYRREKSEKKHLAVLEEISTRFVNFCVPEDIRTHLGKLECPPQLPTLIPAQECWIPISDQIHIPYEPKYFTYEFTLGRAPDEMHEIFRQKGLAKFMSTFGALEDNLKITDGLYIQVKRTPHGVLFRPLEKDKQGRIKVKKDDPGNADKDWFEWRNIPGY